MSTRAPPLRRRCIPTPWPLCRLRTSHGRSPRRWRPCSRCRSRPRRENRKRRLPGAERVGDEPRHRHGDGIDVGDADEDRAGNGAGGAERFPDYGPARRRRRRGRGTRNSSSSGSGGRPPRLRRTGGRSSSRRRRGGDHRRDASRSTRAGGTRRAAPMAGTRPGGQPLAGLDPPATDGGPPGAHAELGRGARLLGGRLLRHPRPCATAIATAPRNMRRQRVFRRAAGRAGRSTSAPSAYWNSSLPAGPSGVLTFTIQLPREPTELRALAWAAGPQSAGHAAITLPITRSFILQLEGPPRFGWGILSSSRRASKTPAQFTQSIPASLTSAGVRLLNGGHRFRSEHSARRDGALHLAGRGAG